ncbi:MAG: DUF4836 family protein [Bacteroidetes bacterium]|nr:DUF4836 family protein [Bacteroidota bacterium]
MNSIKLLTTYLAASVILLIAACKKEAKMPGDALAYVPANSTAVTAIDLKKLMQKADFESIKKMEFFQNMVKETQDENPQLTKVLLDPAASGIDLESKIYTSTSFGEENPEEVTTYFFIPLKDASAFEAMWKSNKDELSEKEGIKILDGGGNAIMGWNKSLAVFAFSNETSDALEQRLVNAFKVDEKNATATNANLQKALSGDHDITSWMSTNPLAKNAGAGFALSMVNVKSEALKDNFIHSYADFEKGRMVGHSDFFINKELGENFIGKFFKKETSTDFSKVLPNEKPTFATVLALDLRGIDQFLSERPQNKDYADFVLNNLGVKRQDMLEAFGGDLLVAGFGSNNLQNTKIMAATNLKNEARAREILQAAVKDKKLKEIEPGYYAITSVGNEDFSITVNRGMGKILIKNGLLVFSTDNDLMAKVKSGDTGTSAGSAFQNFDNQALAGWVDFGAVQNFMGGLEGTHFKDMNFKVNGKDADFILETADPNTNSLKSFFEMMNAAYKQRGKLPEESL